MQPPPYDPYGGYAHPDLDVGPDPLATEITKIVVSSFPVLGVGVDAMEMITCSEQGDTLCVILAAIGVIPGVGDVIATAGKGIKLGVSGLQSAKSADGLVDLASPSRRDHILEGHRHGGEHGNAWFPAGWSDDKIMHSISDIATDPSLKWTQQTGAPGAAYTHRGAPVKYFVDGERDGIKIRVIVQPGGEGIITGYPVQ